MKIFKLLLKNFTAILIVIVLFVIFLTGIAGRYYINRTITNWQVLSKEKIEESTSIAKKIFKEREKKLLLTKEKIFVSLRQLKNIQFKSIANKLKSEDYKNFQLALFNKNDSLLYWNKFYEEEIFLVDTLSYSFGSTHFVDYGIDTYLAVKDTLTINNKIFKFFLSQIIEKEYELNDLYFNNISLNSEISSKINSEFKIDYSPSAKKNRDGRKYSFDLLNYKDKKIGVAVFTKPSREKAIQHLEKLISTIQGAIALIGFLLLGYILYGYLKVQKYFILKLLALTLYLFLLRYILILLNFPKVLFTSELFTDKYYFTNFGNGIAASPIDLFITLFFLFVIFSYIIKLSLYNYLAQKSKSKSIIISFFILLVGIVIYMLALRGFGAAIRGFVFDTTIRYFHTSSLSLTLPQLIMQINVLLIGVISILGSISILLLILKYVATIKSLKIRFIFFLIVFVISEFLYTIYQSDPQLTLFVKLLQISFVFIISWLLINFKLKFLSKLLLFFLSASIISISALLYYNSALEKSSLKKTAEMISRVNKELYQSLIKETLLSNFSRKISEKAFSNNKINFNTAAFKIWSKSDLRKESINSSVNFLSLSGNMLGGFGSIYPNLTLNNIIDTNEVIEEIKVFEEPLEIENQKLIRGIFPVKNDYAFLGYLDVSILWDLNDFGFNSHPEFISNGKLNKEAILKLNKLIILDYRNAELKLVYGNLTPNQGLNNTIVNAELSEKNDAWLDIDINDSEYIVYVKKSNRNGFDRRIAVALKEKDLKIGLFDFFKIFYSYTLIILTIIILYFLFNRKSRRELKIDLRTKLLAAFLIISIIPLLLTAFYFRNLTEEKNIEAVYYKLGKRAFNIEKYLNNNLEDDFTNELFARAAKDLNLSYSIYRMKNLEYSTYDLLYNVGLIPNLINPVAYLDLDINNSREILLEESIDEFKYHSFYYKANLLNNNYIIKVTDGFNNISLPLSGNEVDVFLFGFYFLTAILIVIFSFIFANQISLPLLRITAATKSVAAGDLNLELNTNAKGELGELENGFQYMIKKLKENQMQLAEIEREEAWKEMAKQVAHEIKNPLTPMKLSVQQLIASYNDKSDKYDSIFKKVTDTLLNQIETLKNIATEFSNFARMPKLKVENINLMLILNQAANLFRTENIYIKINSGSDDAIIKGDPEQLQRAFINLFRNSKQAEADKIELTLSEDEKEFVLSVKDNGTGIEDKNQKKIFEQNFTTKQDGMGLGLSMTKRYMKSTNGKIILSETSNAGTTFTLIFPKVI
ncbi:MAG: hypothetical protein CR986_00195 [Ignavibacteriae bacterium]|nr:MAG: hypothetical protein CR986_00195 [Ignavibacteriota bacterium]